MARIIFAEDDGLNASLLAEMLEFLGHSVSATRNGLEFCSVAASRPFDLAILDLDMPILDGMSAMQRIRTDERFKHLPIIAISGARHASLK